MSFATRLAAGGKSPIYVLEFEGDEVAAAAFEAATDWTGSTDVSSLAADTTQAKAGTASIGWNKTGATEETGNVVWSSATAYDLSKHRYWTIWVKAPTTTAGALSEFAIIIGNSAAVYYRWVLPAAYFTLGAWHKLYLSTTKLATGYTSFNEAGTVDRTAIDYIKINWFGASAAYTFTGARVDALRGHPYRISTGALNAPVADTLEGWMDPPSITMSRYDPTNGTLSSASASCRVVDEGGSTVIDDLDNFAMTRRQATVLMGFRGDTETSANFEAIHRGIVDVIEHQGKAWVFQIGDLLRLFRRPFAQDATDGSPYTITGKVVDVWLKLATSTGNGTNQGSFTANYDTETAVRGAGISADLFSAEIETKRDDWMDTDTCSFTFTDSQPSLLDWFLKEVCLAFAVFPVVRGDGLLSIRSVREGVYPGSSPQTLGTMNILAERMPSFSQDAERVKNQVRILYGWNATTEEFASDTANTYQLADSVSRYGVQELLIESKGLTDSGLVARIANRYLRMLGDGSPPVELEALVSQQARVNGELVKLTIPRTFPDIEGQAYGITGKLAQIEGRSFDPARARCSLGLGVTSYRQGNYRLIGPVGMADYDSQTQAVKDTYCSISDGTSLGTDGDPEHEIGP